MKTHLLLLLFILPTIASAQSPMFRFYKTDYFQKPAEAYKFKSAFKESDHYNEWDVTYNRLELSVDPNINYISGSVYFELQSLTDQLTSVTIDLSNSLSVKSVSNGKTNFPTTHKNDKIVIDLPVPLKKNETISFTIVYEGIPTTSGFGAFTQKKDVSLEVIFTLSEPYGAMEWWPCKQSLIDKIDSIDIVVTSPEKYRTASNGLLISDEIKENQRTCHWKHRHPISTYLVFFSTTNYVVYSDWATLESNSKIEVLNYIYPFHEVSARRTTPKTAEYLKLYSKLFIDYPFKNEKYGHAEFSWGGGMEHQTMSSMGSFQPSLIAHELAHQWFGDYITCGSWKDIWLNEGFATFLTGLTYEHLDPDPWWYNWRKQIIDEVTSVSDGSVYCTDTTDIWRIFDSRLSYDKGGFVLHMLRGQLGDEAFFSGMKNYLTDPRVTNGFATTALFRENMEQAADTTLTEFFNDWIYGEGHPIYDINWYYTNHEVTININQTPSAFNGPFFEMKIPFKIYLNGNSETHWLSNTSPSQQFSVALNSNPDSIKVDHDLWLLATYQSITNVDSMKTGEYTFFSYLTDNYLFIDVKDVELAHCAIFNINGKRMSSSKWDQYNKRIEVGSFPTGVYFLQFNSTQVNFVTKFMISEK